MCEQIDPETVLIPAGCVDRVDDHLRQSGYQVSVRDHRNIADLILDEETCVEVDRWFQGLPEDLGSACGGTLLADRGFHRNKAIAAISYLLRDEKVFVACSTRERTHKVARAMDPWVQSVACVHGRNWRSGERVVCGTFASLDSSDPQDWDVILYEDALEATAKANHDARRRYGWHRVYAFASPGDVNNHKNKLLTELLAGPIINPPDTRAAVSNVTFARYEAPSVSAAKKDPMRDNMLLINNDHRNQAIASIAEALVNKDMASLWRFGLFLNREALSTNNTGVFHHRFVRQTRSTTSRAVTRLERLPRRP